MIQIKRFLNHPNGLVITRTIKTSCILSKKGPERIDHPPAPGYDQEAIKKLNKLESISSIDDWMRVRYKNRNVKERIIHAIATDDRLVTESKEAQQISDSKLRAFESSLVARGYDFGLMFVHVLNISNLIFLQILSR